MSMAQKRIAQLMQIIEEQQAEIRQQQEDIASLNNSCKGFSKIIDRWRKMYEKLENVFKDQLKADDKHTNFLRDIISKQEQICKGYNKAIGSFTGKENELPVLIIGQRPIYPEDL